MISECMKGKGQELEQEKTEVLLITNRRKYNPLKHELEGHSIHVQDSLRYLMGND